MIHAEKQRLRALLRERAEVRPSGDSSDLITRLTRLDCWEESSSVLLYAALPGEPDPMGIMRLFPEKHFLFPRVNGTFLELYRWTSGGRWIPGPANFPELKEPDPDSWELWHAGEIDLALIPGLGFDTEGRRLGRGKGFYDRLLGDPLFRARKVALAWEWQIAEQIPTEDHDVTMDLIVTEKRVIRPTALQDQADWTSHQKADRS